MFRGALSQINSELSLCTVISESMVYDRSQHHNTIMTSNVQVHNMHSFQTGLSISGTFIALRFLLHSVRTGDPPGVFKVTCCGYCKLRGLHRQSDWLYVPSRVERYGAAMRRISVTCFYVA